MTVKKIPMRTCIVCREEKPKKELIRIVKNKEGELFLDRTGKANGRGAYVCDSKTCMEKLLKKKLLNKTFEMNISDEVYKGLEEAFFGEK